MRVEPFADTSPCPRRGRHSDIHDVVLRLATFSSWLLPPVKHVDSTKTLRHFLDAVLRKKPSAPLNQTQLALWHRPSLKSDPDKGGRLRLAPDPFTPTLS